MSENFLEKKREHKEKQKYAEKKLLISDDYKVDN